MFCHYMWWWANGEKNWTFTKDYVVGFSQAELDIPTVLLNFVGGQTGHSKCIIPSLQG